MDPGSNVKVVARLGNCVTISKKDLKISIKSSFQRLAQVSDLWTRKDRLAWREC